MLFWILQGEGVVVVLIWSYVFYIMQANGLMKSFSPWTFHGCYVDFGCYLETFFKHLCKLNTATCHKPDPKLILHNNLWICIHPLSKLTVVQVFNTRKNQYLSKHTPFLIKQNKPFANNGISRKGYKPHISIAKD